MSDARSGPRTDHVNRLASRRVELDHEPRAGFIRLDPHPAAHRLDLALDDREPEAGAAAVATASRIDPVEPLEHPILLPLRDAGAAIGDGHAHAVGRFL